MKYCFYPGCAFETSAGYRESFDSVIKELELDFEEIEDWNCCGATVTKGFDDFKFLVLTGRNFAKAHKQGFSVITTGCNACYTTLQKAALKLSNKEIWEKAAAALATEGLKLPEKMEIKHIIEVLAEIPAEKWKSKRPDFISDINVAAYYGCQLTHPVSNVGNPEKPEILEKLLDKMGFTVTEHSAGTMCCGASLAVPHGKSCEALIDRILDEVKYKEADVVTSICPLCQFNLDNQSKDMPITFITQLAGLSLGISPDTLGFKKLLTKATRILK